MNPMPKFIWMVSGLYNFLCTQVEIRSIPYEEFVE